MLGSSCCFLPWINIARHVAIRKLQAGHCCHAGQVYHKVFGPSHKQWKMMKDAGYGSRSSSIKEHCQQLNRQSDGWRSHLSGCETYRSAETINLALFHPEQQQKAKTFVIALIIYLNLGGDS